MQLKTLLIQWNGKNYLQIIQALDSKNQELKVRVQGKRLIVRDEEAGFYRVFAIDDVIEVPTRPCEPDEPYIPEPPKPLLMLPPPRYEVKTTWSVGPEWEIRNHHHEPELSHRNS